MSTTAERPEFLTVRELADYLRVSLRTAYELVYRGDVPAIKVGGVYRIRLAELDRKLDGPAARRRAERPRSGGREK